jgi:hypothetical protein
MERSLNIDAERLAELVACRVFEKLTAAGARVEKPHDRGERRLTDAIDELDATPGQCPVHKKVWRDGKFGPYCATKNADDTWCRERPR